MTGPQLNFAAILLATALLSACGGSSGSSAGNGANNPNNKLQPKNPVDWASIPSEYNPSQENIVFQTVGFEKLNVDAFGFNDDVEIIYSPSVAAGNGYVRLFKVWKESVSWGSLRPRPNGKTLGINGEGTYACSINIRNGQITALKGGCYVKMQIYLPADGTELEVYSVNQLISKRFFPMDTATFIKQFDDATWDEDKWAVIENYLASYQGMTKVPALTAKQLGTVVGDFIHAEDKYKALTRLHTFISDRQNLNAMIEDKFSYFERPEAKRIVGL
ncbi:MAG: DUF4476 domain-containing protein [Bdellovibrionaceae bacterium]|nr:DUF4476 domain-containing protein [Pseudobdellovibrionaceae bacterium]